MPREEGNWKGMAHTMEPNNLGPQGRDKPRQPLNKAKAPANRFTGKAIADGYGLCLKPYWGKPTVRNFRGGGGNLDYGPLAFQGATALLDRLERGYLKTGPC